MKKTYEAPQILAQGKVEFGTHRPSNPGGGWPPPWWPFEEGDPQE